MAITYTQRRRRRERYNTEPEYREKILSYPHIAKSSPKARGMRRLEREFLNK